MGILVPSKKDHTAINNISFVDRIKTEIEIIIVDY